LRYASAPITPDNWSSAIPVLGEIPDAAAMIGITLATLGVVLASGVFGSALKPSS